MSIGRLLSLGIRREVKNKWERRVPLTPSHVQKLVKDLNATVYVQPSTKRIFPDSAYVQAGARLEEDLSKADVIIGVKEVPVTDLIANKTYLFFSHTHKGQSYNMPMLKDILDKKIQLLDYELLKDEKAQRLVQFSRFAGYAGMVDGLHSMARRLLALGYGSPFLAIGMSYMYRCLADARLDVIRSGLVIQDDGLPKELGPMSFVFTGDGNVTQGALHIFKCLPHEWVAPSDLKSLMETRSSFDNKKVYGCIVRPQDYLIHKEGKPFEKQEYFKSPELYESIFAQKVAPYSRMILNGIFWDQRYPRLLTLQETKKLAEVDRLPLLTVADVSCDINGSLEFTSKAATIDEPYFMYDPLTGKTHGDVDGPGIQIMSIDNLPTEMPLEASEYFGSSLYPFIVELVKGNFNHPVIRGAAITTPEGKLASSHTKLYDSIKKHTSSSTLMGQSKRKKILVLGSGFVAGPLVDYLHSFPNFEVTIASDKLHEAAELTKNRNRVEAKKLDINESFELSNLISSHDIVVSLIPASMHPIIAASCIQHKKHMVTASYISAAMAQLDQKAKEKGITIMNEIGLDPGIDHLTALAAFEDIKSSGGKITEFVSWCGGLPAPEVSDNPLGYKFSWSPKGVLLASSNSATYLWDSKKVDIDGSKLLQSAEDVSIMNGFALEGYANRDSLKYIDLYKLDKQHLKSMFRGTLRYKGFSELMDAFKRIGLMSQEPISKGLQSWKSVMERLLKSKLNSRKEQVAALGKQLGTDISGSQVQRVHYALNWLGLFSDESSLDNHKSYLDAFCSLLESKLEYGPHERDMVIMHHVFGYLNREGKHQRRTSTMVAYGDPQGDSAMAKTVGWPAAVATEMILNGQIQDKGVIGPMEPHIYRPMLDKLETLGIRFVEKTIPSEEF